MFSDTIFLTILAYGILYVIIITLVRFVARDVLHGKYQDKSEMAKVYRAIYGDNNWDQFGIILAIIVIGYFLPQIAVLFFILIPTRNFISNANKQQAFEDIEHLEPNGRQAYLDMDNKNRIEFAKMTRSFIQDLSNQPEADSQQIVDRYSKEISERFGISAKDWQRWSTHLIERAQHARRRQERQELHNNRKNKNTLKK